MQLPIDAITSRLGDRFNSVRSQSFSSRFANLRPVSEFLDLKRLSKPANFGEVQGRVNYNLSYFSSNYAAVFVMLSIYSLLTNPLLLFVILLVTGGLYGIGKLEGRDLDVQVARFNTSQLYTGLLVLAVPLGIWASPISTVLWLIGATGGGLGGRPRAPYDMPQWGRPPGARLGRPTRGRAVAAAAAQRMWDDSRIAEIDNAVMEEEEDGDEYMRQARQLATVGRNNRTGGWEWRDPVYDNYNNNYHDYYADETGSVDGVEYDLYDDTDSTVAYAIELAMKDKEEWLVDRALERIRRAQVSGQNNVRISKRELEALERKRGHQTSEFNGSSPRGTSTRRVWQVMDSPIKGANGHTRPRRSGSGASQKQALLPSPQRPRTPTMQPLQPQNTNASPRSPVKPPYPSQPFPRRGSNDRRISNNPFSQVISLRPGSDNENHDHKAKERDDSGDQVQIVDVVKRRVPISPSPRRSRGSRR